MELVDGVYALPVTIELEEREVTLHPAAVETERGVLLLDAGWPGAIDSIGTLADRDVKRTLCYHGGYVEHERDTIATIWSDQAG